ncbi:hypothetical protein FOXB_16030, partial [Fusarium oxysporum f. sp. conglutinans Fo5176]
IPNGAGTTKPESKPASGPIDPHDNDTANGLYMLGQGRDGARSTNQFAVAQQNRNASPQVSSVNGGSIGSARGMSDGSIVLDESEKARPKMRDETGGRWIQIKMTDEEMRKNFLGRNRIAALKFRQRKKRWLTNLQIKVEIFNTENDALTVIRTVQLLSNMDSTVPSYYRSLGPSIRR